MAITNSSPIAPEIRYGSTITYTLAGSPSCGSITHVSWKYKFAGPGCTTGWSPSTSTGTNRTIVYPEYYVGNHVIQADVTVMCGYSSTVVPVSATITVVAPDDIDLPDPMTGANTVTLALGTSTTFAFPVKCRGERVGYLQGSAKEDLTNRISRGKRLGNLMFVGDPNLLHLQGASIIDHKMWNTTQPITSYNAIPLGTSLRSMRQKLYVVLPELCGGTMGYPMATSFDVNYTKAAVNGQYTITITP